MLKQFRELYEYRGLLGNLISIELKLRYRNSLLGFLWTILNPLCYLAILAIVFSKIIRFQIPNYTIFLYAGLVSYTMIQQTVTIATSSIVANQGLIRRVYLPKIVLPLSNVLARYLDHLTLTVLLIGAMVLFRAPLTWSLLFVPVAVLLHFIFSFGLSLITTVAHIRVRDIQHIVAIIFQILFYASPVLYAVDLLPEKYRIFFIFNPIYYFIQVLRYPVAYGTLPPTGIGFTAAAIALVTLLGGLWVFFKEEKTFIFSLS